MAWGSDAVRDLAIRTLIGESDGSPEGMTSVAHVMKNRADSGAWGAHGLTRTITAPKQFRSGTQAIRTRRPCARSRQPIPAISAPRRSPMACSAIKSRIRPRVRPTITRRLACPEGLRRLGCRPDPNGDDRRAPFLPPGAQRLEHRRQRRHQPLDGRAGVCACASSSASSGVAHHPNSIVHRRRLRPPGDGRQAALQRHRNSCHRQAGSAVRADLQPNARRRPRRCLFGYHYIVDRDGKVYQTAPEDVRTNHIMGNKEHGLSNENAIGVAFVGGAPAEEPAADDARADGGRQGARRPAQGQVQHRPVEDRRAWRAGSVPHQGPQPGRGRGRGRVPHRLPRSAGAAPAAAAPTPNPDAPAPQAQPVAAVAPPGSPPTPGSSQNPSAGFVGPGSDEYRWSRG